MGSLPRFMARPPNVGSPSHSWKTVYQQSLLIHRGGCIGAHSGREDFVQVYLLMERILNTHFGKPAEVTVRGQQFLHTMPEAKRRNSSVMDRTALHFRFR